MISSVQLFKAGQNTNTVKQNPQKVSFTGSELSQSINAPKDKNNSLKLGLFLAALFIMCQPFKN